MCDTSVQLAGLPYVHNSDQLTAGFLQHNGCRLVSTCNVKESDDTHLDLQILKSRFKVGRLADGDLLQQELHLLSCFS